MLRKLKYLAELLPSPASDWVLALENMLSERVRLEPKGDWLANALKALPMLMAVARPWLERLMSEPDELVALFDRLEEPALALLERVETTEIDEEQLGRWLEWLSEQLVSAFEGSLRALDREQLNQIVTELERFILYVAEQAAFGRQGVRD